MKNKQNTTKDFDRFSKYFSNEIWIQLQILSLWVLIWLARLKISQNTSISKVFYLNLNVFWNSSRWKLYKWSNSKKIAKKSLGSLVTLFTNSLTSPSIYSLSSHTSCLITFFFGEVKGNSMKPANRIVFSMHLPPIQTLVACAQQPERNALISTQKVLKKIKLNWYSTVQRSAVVCKCNRSF